MKKEEKHNPVTCPVCLKEDYFRQTPLYKDITSLLDGKTLPERFKKARPLSETELTKIMTQHQQDILQSKFGQEAMSLFMVALQSVTKTALHENREPTIDEFMVKFSELAPPAKKNNKRLHVEKLREYLQTYLEPPDRKLAGNADDCENCAVVDQCDPDRDCYFYPKGSTQSMKRRKRAKVKRILQNIEKGGTFGKY